MPGNAVIGALRVALGLDSAQFESGLKKAQSGLAGFGKTASLGFAATAAAAAAAGTALGFAVKGAIDTADNMSKAAQKVGVATEALSRLNYAAGYSDVSLEQLSGGLQKLTKNLADVASGKGGSAATALQMLGISATDSTGKLRDADSVFADIADRFGRLEDGSTKTALAMQLFGKTGAELIPLLNTGRDGLSAMADESDRLGLTISTDTGRAAEQFNDTLTKVGRIVEGVVMQIAEAALPALQELADTLASPEFAQAAQSFGAAIITVFNGVVQAATAVVNAIDSIGEHLEQQKGNIGFGGTVFGDVFGLGGGTSQSATDPAGSGASFSQLSGFGFGTSSAAAASLTVPTFGEVSGQDAMAKRLDALRVSLATEEQLELDSHNKRLEEIQGFYDQGLIKKGEYDSLILAAQAEHSDKMVELAKEQAEKEAAVRYALADTTASIFGSLATIAENAGERGLAASKAFAVAQVIVSTAAGIMKAFEQTGILGWAGAAAIAATGAAQISTIMSTQKGSGSRPTVNGGGAAAAAVEPASTQTAEPGRAVNITFQGLDRAAMEQFVGQLNDALGDGVRLNLNAA